MLLKQIIGVITTLFVVSAPNVMPKAKVAAPRILAAKQYSLSDRYNNTYVNDVFADNILLTLAYMQGIVKSGQKIDWDQVRSQSEFEFTLNPGQTFAFHDRIAPQYQATVTKTTNAHFNLTEGFKSDGWLVGDGVCHLASFMNVVATDAGLKVDAPTRHDFAAIPDVSREFGTSIYYTQEGGNSTRQNLYVTNTTQTTIVFAFHHKQDKLDITVQTL